MGQLEDQKKMIDAAAIWFQGKFKTTLDDNRRRYRMQLKDSAERKALGLSAIPSVKSAGAVDRFVERSLIEYHQDPDSISFTARELGNTEKDQWARWLTQDFVYRSDNTFPFFTWNQASLTAVGVDGFECALVRWEKTSYPEKTLQTFADNPETGRTEPIPRHIFEQFKDQFPEVLHEVEVMQEVPCVDTWMIDQLEPGVDVIWDPKAALLDSDMMEFVAVFLDKSPQNILNMAKRGVINPVSVEDLKKYQKTGLNVAIPTTITRQGTELTLDNPDNIDLKELNRVKLWYYFHKIDNKRYVTFSLDGKLDLGTKPVDEVFFGGRKVDRWPVVIGTTKLKLWESAGRSIPETIAPIEDEHIDHKNNINDAAKQQIQGRFRLDPDSNINLNDLLNGRAVYANPDEFSNLAEKTNFGFMETIRANDSTVADIAEMVPASVMGARGLVPKGTAQTLGAKQMGKMEGDEKQGVHIMTRNQTFLKKVLYLIAQLTMAYETDEVILRIAAGKAGVQPPEQMNFQGQRKLDVSVLDFSIDVKINAGLGSAPRYQKAQATMEIAGWRKENGVPTDFMAIARQLNTLAGFDPDAFTPPAAPPPPPPPVEHKLTLKATWQDLLAADPTVIPILLKLLKEGNMPVNATVEDSPETALAKQNGGGLYIPDRTGQVVDSSGDAGMAMSMGGQGGMDAD